MGLKIVLNLAVRLSLMLGQVANKVRFENEKNKNRYKVNELKEQTFLNCKEDEIANLFHKTNKYQMSNTQDNQKKSSAPIPYLNRVNNENNFNNTNEKSAIINKNKTNEHPKEKPLPQTKIPQIKKAAELKQSKSYQALPIYKSQKSNMLKSHNKNANVINERITRKIVFESNTNGVPVEECTEIETSPVEEVLSYQPVKKEVCSGCNTISYSEKQAIEPGNLKGRSQRKLEFMDNKNSQSQNNRYNDGDKSEYPIIDLNYHFQSFKNHQKLLSSPEYRLENNGTKESIFEIKSELKSSSSEVGCNSQERNHKFEEKRQEVLRRKEKIEKQRIERITQKIKEKDDKFKKINESKNNNFMSSTFDRNKSKSIIRERTTERNGSYKSVEKESKNKVKIINYKTRKSTETTPIMKQQNKRKRENESFEKCKSPSISWISPSKACRSPDTPDYCPIINAQYRKDWIAKIKPYEEISEFPLNVEESESKLEFEMSEAPKTTQSSLMNSPEQYKSKKSVANKGIQKCKSKDSFHKTTSNISNASILKAFKNSPCDQFLIEYFKKKSIMEKRYSRDAVNSSKSKS